MLLYNKYESINANFYSCSFFSITPIGLLEFKIKKNFKNYITGDWRIENPTLQSFIRFDPNGKTTYFLNRYSYELDTLAEYGSWHLKDIYKGVSLDTFVVEIIKKPQNTEFKFLILEQNRIRVLDEAGETLFTRVHTD